MHQLGDVPLAIFTNLAEKLCLAFFTLFKHVVVFTLKLVQNFNRAEHAALKSEQMKFFPNEPEVLRSIGAPPAMDERAAVDTVIRFIDHLSGRARALLISENASSSNRDIQTFH